VAERSRLFAELDGRGKKLLILTEGVVPYLSVEDAGSLADDLRRMRHARYWIVEYLSAMAMRMRERSGITKKTKNAPFKFKPQNWFTFFSEHGWNVREMRYFAEEGERLKRALHLPVTFRMLRAIRMFFISKERREAFRKAAGYALLGPVHSDSNQ